MSNQPRDPFEDFHPEFLSDRPSDDPEQPPATSGLPHSREAEEAVAGCVLINPSVYYDLELFLKDSDFYIHRLGYIWAAYTRLYKRQVPIDILTVSEELEDMGRLDEIGGQAYLTALLNQVPTSLHAEAYGQIVKAASVRRELLRRANQIAVLAYDTKKTMEDILGEVDRITNTPIETSQNTNVPAEIAALRLMERIDLARTDPQALAVPVYGMEPLQRCLGGFPRKSVTLVYGDSSIGKTALMLQIAESTAAEKMNVLYITLESNADAMVARRVFGEIGVDGKFARAGVSDDAVFDKINEGIRNYMDKYAGFLTFNEEAWTLSQFNQAVRQCKPDLVIVDYLAEMMSEENDNETRTLLKNLRGIKKTIKRINAAGVVIHSMTDDAIKIVKLRKKDNVAPPLEGSLGWARDLRYICDIAICLVESVESKGQNPLLVYAWIMKDRESGNTKNVAMLYYKKQQVFRPGPQL